MSTLNVDKVDPSTGTTLELGTSGDTISIPSGVTIANSGTATGFGAALTGSTNNTVTTVTGANAISGEANLTFDGSTLAVTGAATVSTTLGVTGAITGSSTLEGTTITATSDINVGNDINLTSDDSVISFGANSEVKLTHKHNGSGAGRGLSLTGGVPQLWMGNGTTENTFVYFDGNAHDYRIGLYDSQDYLEIGYGLGQGRYSALMIDYNKHLYVQGTVTDSGASELGGCASMWMRNEQATTRHIAIADDATITPNLVGGSAAVIFVGASYSGHRGCVIAASYGSSTIVMLADPTGEFEVNGTTEGKSLCFTKTINSPVITVTNKWGASQNCVITTISNYGL